MKAKKYWWIMLAVLLVLSIAVVVIGFQVRNQQLEQEKKESVLIALQGQETVIPLSRLDREAFSKETVNGKGEKAMNSYRGIEVKTLLQECGMKLDQVSGMTVTAADQYSAEYTGDEIRDSERIYLVVKINEKEIEGIEPGQPGFMVIAFGDPNSKRMVRNPVKLEVR